MPDGAPENQRPVRLELVPSPTSPPEGIEEISIHEPSLEYIVSPEPFPTVKEHALEPSSMYFAVNPSGFKITIYKPDRPNISKPQLFINGQPQHYTYGKEILVPSDGSGAYFELRPNVRGRIRFKREEM